MGTFGSLGTVRLGIYAAQKGLDVTGNNITNINTEGYTRQRLNQISLIPSAADRYYSSYKTRIGQGAVITGVTQLRDPGLDISFRNAQSDVGSANGKLAGLDDLATILDEVGKGDGEQDDGVLLSQLNDLRDIINKAIASGGEDYNSLIRASAKSLAGLFNSYANSLETLEKKYVTEFNDQVSEINSILSSIQDLNVAIRNADIRGDEALELRDERNRKLDELSQYIKIDVKYEQEDVGAGTMVEKLVVTLGTGDKNTLIDGKYAAQLSTEEAAAGEGNYLQRNPNYDPNAAITAQNKPYLMPDGTPTIYPDKAAVVDNDNYTLVISALTDKTGEKMNANDYGYNLGDTDLYGSLQSVREILTEKGEYSTADDVALDPDAAIKRGIPYYQKALDNLAFEFAEQMNNLNYTGLAGAGVLFSTSTNNNTTTGITAANISISKDWSEDRVWIQSTADKNAPSGDTSNLSKFLDLFSADQTFQPDDVAGGDAVGAEYTGTFEDMLFKIQSTLGEDQRTTSAILNNYSITQNEIYMDRDSIMGVDLNDEAANLMTYQKAYTAACRLMTVLETALDSLINGTIV